MLRKLTQGLISKWNFRRTYTLKTSSSSLDQLNRYQQKIIEETKISRAHLTPEIALRLITPECRLFHEPLMPDSEKVFSNDPFWAFYWPGGQALSRYILDNPHLVVHRSVLDIGSGCGASSLVALKNGARYVIANDIDEVAGCSVLLNAGLNDLSTENLKISSENLIGSSVTEEIIFLGDLFYDEEIADQLLPWLKDLSKSGKDIYIGDPGRHGLTHSRLNYMKKLITYELPENCCIENHGYRFVDVWRFQ